MHGKLFKAGWKSWPEESLSDEGVSVQYQQLVPWGLVEK